MFHIEIDSDKLYWRHEFEWRSTIAFCVQFQPSAAKIHDVTFCILCGTGQSVGGIHFLEASIDFTTEWGLNPQKNDSRVAVENKQDLSTAAARPRIWTDRHVNRFNYRSFNIGSDDVTDALYWGTEIGWSSSFSTIIGLK